jgi:hypothetical protein
MKKSPRGDAAFLLLATYSEDINNNILTLWLLYASDLSLFIPCPERNMKIYKISIPCGWGRNLDDAIIFYAIVTFSFPFSIHIYINFDRAEQ